MNGGVELALLWGIVVILGILVLGLVAELQSLRTRVSQVGPLAENGLPIGSRVPVFAGTDIWSGRRFDNESLIGRATLLMFVSSTCSLCRDATQALSEALFGSSELQIVLLCSGSENDCSFFCQNLRDQAKLLVDSGESLRRFKVQTVPFVIVIDAAAKVKASKRVTRLVDIKKLLNFVASPPVGVMSGDREGDRGY